MKYFLTFTVVLLLRVQSSVVDASELIGMTVPPYPIGILQDGGACVGEKWSCDKGIGILKTKAGRKFLIFAAKSLPSQTKEARWQITDTLAFPTLQDGEIVDYMDCRMSGHADASVLAVIRENSSQVWFRAIAWAYRVNGADGKFVRVPARQVDCANSDE